MSDEAALQADDFHEVDQPAFVPPAEVLSHAATPLPPEADFFAPPPDEIGPLASADTSLRTNQAPMSPGLRWMLIGGLMLGTSLGLNSLVRLANLEVSTAVQICTAILGLLVGMLVLAKTRFRHTCSYVGRNGIARFTLVGSRNGPMREDRFLFDTAHTLLTSETDNYYNGIYTGTGYDFRWNNREGRKVYQLKGSYHSKQRTPKPKDAYHFAKMAEIAWSLYLLDQAQAEFESNGHVEFPVNRKDRVRVGPGFMEFEFKGKVERVPIEMMQDISINAGWFSFKTSEARMFSSKGKFSFQYGQMGNARLFLMCLDSILGIRFS